MPRRPAARLLAAVALGVTGGLTGAVVRRSRSGASGGARKREGDLLHTLTSRLASAEAEARLHQALMHEVTATVAGLASAAQALPSAAPADRDRLTAMMSAELQRLQRVLGREGADEIRPVEVDEVVGRLVQVHRSRGRTITWERSGTGSSTRSHALGRADALAEAVNVLLDNAARHGSADDIHVEVALRDDRVEVAVSDGGPGVAGRVRDRLFDWGVRHPDSPGQGIGLHVARRRLRDCGGDLRLDDPAAARFVISLPAVVAGRAARREEARVG